MSLWFPVPSSFSTGLRATLKAGLRCPRESLLGTAKVTSQDGLSQQPHCWPPPNKQNINSTKKVLFGDCQRVNLDKCKLHFLFSQENVTFPFISHKNENPFKVLAPSAGGEVLPGSKFLNLGSKKISGDSRQNNQEPSVTVPCNVHWSHILL